MNKYRVIFCGTPEIAVSILKGLESLNIEIVGVITQPDKLIGRKKELSFSPVKSYSIEKAYKLLQPAKVIDVYDEIVALNADYLITCAFGQFIPSKVLELFKNSINVHASLLPKYRGGSPIQYAIMKGEKKTGISLMKMIKKMDAGEVYVQEEIEIDSSDDSGILFNKMAILGKKMIQEHLFNILEGKIKVMEQDEKKVTFAYNLTNEQEKINWDDTSENICNFIRALSPKPIAFTFLGNERLRIKSARLLDENDIFPIPLKIFQPGEIASVNNKGIVVASNNGFIIILELQIAGKKMVEASSYNQPNSAFKMGLILG